MESPIEYGRRLIPKLVDDIASSNPYRPFVSIARSSDLEEGYLDVTYLEFAKAVNRCSWWIQSEIGLGGGSKVLFYIGPLDLRYLIFVLAAAKTGHIAFISSHRNSLEAHLSLLEATQCGTIFLPDQAPAITKQILAGKPMQIVTMPEFDYFMNNQSGVEQYPWQGTFEEMRNKPFVILHTSGSTGTPKPVFVTHGIFASNDAHQLIPSLGGIPTTVDYIKGKRVFLAFPLFHAAGLNFTIGYGIFCGVTCVLPPPGPLNADVVNMVHTHCDLHGSILPPSIIADIYKDPNYLGTMVQRLQFVAYVGGTLPTEIGDTISTKLKVMSLVGSTETLLLPIEVDGDNADWQYLPISKFLGHELRLDRDGLHELVIRRNAELDLFQGVFTIFPNLEEYSMKDLYQQHPTKPGAWAFRARSDDIIAFSNAEKLNPITMEGIISTHPDIKAAVIGGHGEFQASLLIEPKVHPTTPEEQDQLLHLIWPTIVQANRTCPAHGRIMKDFVMFTSPQRPLPIAGKNTVQRHSTLKLYKEEFKAIYTRSTCEAKPKSVLSTGGSKSLKLPTTSTTDSAAEERSTRALCNKCRAKASSLNQAAISTASELEATIEAVLCRVLPEVLQQHLSQALAQVMLNMLRPMMLELNPILEVSGSQPHASREADLPIAREKGRQNGKTSLIEPLTESHYTATAKLRLALCRAISNSTFLEEFDETSDLFAKGLDSLQVPALVKEINSLLIKSRPDAALISDKMIYSNPSIEKLLAAIERSSKTPGSSVVKASRKLGRQG